MLTSMQVKLGRTAVGWGVRDLASAAGVAPSTIQRFESGRGGVQAKTLDQVRRAIEAEGVTFIAADAHGGPGIRLCIEGKPSSD